MVQESVVYFLDVTEFP